MLEYESEKRATSKEILDLLEAWNNKSPLFSNFRIALSNETGIVKPAVENNNVK